SLRTVLRRERRMLVGLVAVSATRSWASSLVTSFLPLYAVARGADLITSSRLLTSFLLAGAIGGLAGGWLAARFGRDRVIVASLPGRPIVRGGREGPSSHVGDFVTDLFRVGQTAATSAPGNWQTACRLGEPSRGLNGSIEDRSASVT